MECIGLNYFPLPLFVSFQHICNYFSKKVALICSTCHKAHHLQHILRNHFSWLNIVIIITKMSKHHKGMKVNERILIASTNTFRIFRKWLIRIPYFQLYLYLSKNWYYNLFVCQENRIDGKHVFIINIILISWFLASFVSHVLRFDLCDLLYIVNITWAYSVGPMLASGADEKFPPPAAISINCGPKT